MPDHLRIALCALGIFLLAIGLRFAYQDASRTRNPLHADAGKYYRAANNLRLYGIHSIEHSPHGPPESRTDLSPGYPLFLSGFQKEGRDWRKSVELIRKAQALLGALTATIAFLIAVHSLPIGWAILAGLLTALSPHLIALDDYILTESLFSFTMMLGALLLTIAWKRELPLLAFAGGLLLAASAQVRAINYALVFALAPLLFLPSSRSSERSMAARGVGVVLIVFSFLCIWGAHRVFVHTTVMNSPNIREEPREFTQILSPWAYLQRSVRPPEFAVLGQSHVRIENGNDSWKDATTASFLDQPTAYLRWNLGQKLYVLWHFDNAYNGDVYIYGMERKGFVEDVLLSVIHAGMRVLHWPLFALSCAAPLALFMRWRRAITREEERFLLIPILGFTYLVGLLFVLSWLPRYSIPARPFSYILASASLFWAIDWIHQRRRASGVAQSGPEG